MQDWFVEEGTLMELLKRLTVTQKRFTATSPGKLLKQLINTQSALQGAATHDSGWVV